MWSRTSANYTSEKFDLFDNKYSLQDGYQVVCTPDTEAPEVLAHPDVPKPNDRHPHGINAFVRARSPERVSPIMWMVTIGYEGYDFDQGSVDVEWSDTTSTEPIDRDINGNAIVTACGEPVMGLTVELADPVVTIRRKFLFLNQYAIGQYRHATNSDDFLGWPPGTARLVGYSATNKFKYGAAEELWDVTARIQFRYPYGGASAAQAWHKRWRHEGLYVRDPIMGPNPVPPPAQVIVGYHFPRRARDINGLEVSTPVLLKLDGQEERDPNAAQFLYTQVYNSLPFSVLGLLT
jgi:hypothetical protein